MADYSYKMYVYNKTHRAEVLKADGLQQQVLVKLMADDKQLVAGAAEAVIEWLEWQDAEDGK